MAFLKNIKKKKKAKNKKVNVRYDHKKAMMDKYGKPKRKRN